MPQEEKRKFIKDFSEANQERGAEVLKRDNDSQYALTLNGRQMQNFGLGIDVELNVLAKKDIPGILMVADEKNRRY